jgi:hypothetical protein
MKKVVLALLLVPQLAFAQQLRVTAGAEYSGARSLTRASSIATISRYLIRLDGYTHSYGFIQRDITANAQFAPVVELSARWPQFTGTLRASYAPGSAKASAQVLRLYGRNFYPLYDVRYIGGAPHHYTARLRYIDLLARGLWRVYEHDAFQLEAGVQALYRRSSFQQRSLTTSYGPVCMVGVGCGLWDNHVTLGNDGYATMVAGGPSVQLSYRAGERDVFRARANFNIGKFWFGAKFIDVDDIWFKAEDTYHWILNGSVPYAQRAEFAVFPELSVAWEYKIGRAAAFTVMAMQTMEPRVPTFIAYAWTTESIGFQRGRLRSSTRLAVGLRIGK